MFGLTAIFSVAVAWICIHIHRAYECCPMLGILLKVAKHQCCVKIPNFGQVCN